MGIEPVTKLQKLFVSLIAEIPLGFASFPVLLSLVVTFLVDYINIRMKPFLEPVSVIENVLVENVLIFLLVILLVIFQDKYERLF